MQTSNEFTIFFIRSSAKEANKTGGFVQGYCGRGTVKYSPGNFVMAIDV